MMYKSKAILIPLLFCSLFMNKAYSQFSDDEKTALKKDGISIKTAQGYRDVNKDCPVSMIVAYEKYKGSNEYLYKKVDKKFYKKQKYSPEKIAESRAWEDIPVQYAALTSKEVYDKALSAADNYSELAITQLHFAKVKIDDYADEHKLSQAEHDKVLKDFFASKYDKKININMAAYFAVNGVTPETISSYPDYLTPLEVLALATGKIKSDYYKIKVKEPTSKITIHNYRQEHPATDGTAQDRYELLSTGGFQYGMMGQLYKNKEKYVFNEPGEGDTDLLVDVQKSSLISKVDGKTQLIDFIKKAQITTDKLFDSVTNKQEGLLYIEGAARVYFVVNEAPSYVFNAYKVSDTDTVEAGLLNTIVDYENFAGIWDPELAYFLTSYYVHGFREILTLNNIIEKADKYGFSDCALIFGAAHDFKKYETNLLAIEEMSVGQYMSGSRSGNVVSAFINAVFDNFDKQKEFVLKLLEGGADDTKAKDKGAPSTDDVTQALLNEIWGPIVFHESFDMTKIKSLVADGAKLNEPVSWKTDSLTPLELVVAQSCDGLDEGIKELVKFLIQAGSDVNKISLLDVNRRCDWAEKLPIIKFLVEDCNIKIKNIDSIITVFENSSDKKVFSQEKFKDIDEKKAIVKYLKQVKKSRHDQLIETGTDSNM